MTAEASMLFTSTLDYASAQLSVNMVARFVAIRGARAVYGSEA